MYRAFLSEFPPRIVREFFEQVPLLIDGLEIRGKCLYDLLWKRKGHVPMEWEIKTDNRLEDFLIARGKDPGKVIPEILHLSGGSLPIPGKIILGWFYPKLESLFNRFDSRDICFGLITLVTENYLPGRIHRRVLRREADGWVENFLVYIDSPDHAYFLDWEYEFIAGPMIVEAPLKLGLPAFEHFGMVADTRPPEKIVSETLDSPTLESGKLLIRGEEFGALASFQAFLEGIELDVAAFSPPDVEVVVMGRDYHCPRRKRVVLHAGCAYGAPFFICRTRHRKRADGKAPELTPLIKDIEREDKEEEADSLERKHQELLATFRDTANFSYHAADESLSLNGKHFAKGIPAKIMRSLLQSYLRTGRTDFEYREFKRDFEISLGQKNANFEVRFYRLMEKVAEQGGSFRIEKTGRGAFRFHVEVDVRLEEAETALGSADG